MASSWYAQIPVILTLFRELQPRSVLDVGKGIGKYGLLLHEYYGLDDRKATDPERTLNQQSRLPVDCVESEPRFLWPHIPQFYRSVYVGRVEELLEKLPNYHVVFMADVIEHIEKTAAVRTVQHFLNAGSVVVVSSPIPFFQQAAWDSPDETHVSHWTPKDFSFCSCEWQRVGPSRIYALSKDRIRFKTFGRGVLRRLKRIAHAFQDEIP